ncbi:MAG TPA: DHHA1 domain-containing protein, partial [Candidatus Sulfotelmatobacter sp.]|nr:DHHA1 domain-containing protein [Candidatus Sulfotelmatobacter sp.]
AAQAEILLSEIPEKNGRRLVVRTFSERDLNFLKLLAQKLTRQSATVALLGTTTPRPLVVFAQSAGQPYDMAALLRETLSKIGGRGGGSKDLAQGGAPSSAGLTEAVESTAQSIVQ